MKPTSVDLLNQEFAFWSQAGHRLRLWWRDDDIIEPTRALEKLLTLQQQFSIPLSLAVIPAKLRPSLSEYLADQPGLTILQHGITHHNNALPEQKKIELGGGLRGQDCAIGLSKCREILEQYFPNLFVPVLVPPWNRLDPFLLPIIEQANFIGLSLFGTKPYSTHLRCINTHLDIINWPTRGFIGYETLLNHLWQTAQDLRQQRRWYEPIGLLTHHLVHDEACWEGLAQFLAVLQGSPHIKWHNVKQFLDIHEQPGVR